MKRVNLGKKLAMFSMCLMLLGTSMVVHAAVTPGHECSFTFVERESYGATNAGTHSYTVKYENGEAVVATCSVSVAKFADVYRCGCGAEYKNPFSVTRHSSCGQ